MMLMLMPTHSPCGRNACGMSSVRVGERTACSSCSRCSGSSDGVPEETTSAAQRPARRSCTTRCSTARLLPRQTCTSTPYFLVNASTTGVMSSATREV